MKIKRTLAATLLLITALYLIPGVWAAIAIEIEHIGYGNTPSDIFLTIRNTGDVHINGLEIYANGELTEERDVYLPAGRAIKIYTYLTPGDYTIELKTPEGAYDSIDLTVGKARELIEEERPPTVTTTTTAITGTTTTISPTTTRPTGEVWPGIGALPAIPTYMYIGIAIIVIIVVAILWAWRAGEMQTKEV